jgi:hypothetical protein
VDLAKDPCHLGSLARSTTENQGIEVLDLKSLSIAAAAGDQAAFSTLVETHFGRLYTFARSLLRDEQEAEDAVGFQPVPT